MCRLDTLERPRRFGRDHEIDSTVSPMAATAAILLTGGRSRRLGVDKATLVVDGESLARRAARRLAVVCDPVIETGDGVSGLRAVREEPAGAGPLAALAAAGAT